MTELRLVRGDATPDEVAAIVAAIAVIEAQHAAAAAAALAAAPSGAGRVSEWVHASRLSARRSGMTRGPWRLSGRVTRRTRA